MLNFKHQALPRLADPIRFLLVGAVVFGLIIQPISSIAFSKAEQGPEGDGTGVSAVIGYSIQGYVWDDNAVDKSFDPADIGLEGWTVEISKAPAPGESILPILGPETTDATGFYKFENLRPGTYTVCQVDKVELGWKQTFPDSTSDNPFGCHEITVELATNRDEGPANYNFGNFLMGFGSISGVVWNDADGDATRIIPDEVGLENWTVNLLTSCSEDFNRYDLNLDSVIDPTDFSLFTGLFNTFSVSADLNGDGLLTQPDEDCFGILYSGGSIDSPLTVIGTTTSDADGNYSFADLGYGNYWVNEDVQVDWTQTKPGGDGVYGPLGVAPTTSWTEQDFGNWIPVAEEPVIEEEEPVEPAGEEVVIEEEEVVLPVIELDKIASANSVIADAQVTYTFNYTVSDATASSVVLSDPLPDYMTFVSASDEGAYDPLTNVVTWNLGDKEPGNYLTTMTVQVDGVITNGTKIENVATISASEIEPVTDNAIVTVNSRPVLTVKKMIDQDTASRGDTLLYTVLITNEGTDTAKNLTAKDILPQGFTTKDDQVSEFSVKFNDLEVDKSVATSYEVVVGDQVAKGSYDNTVTASADNTESVSATATVEIEVLGEVLGVETVAEPEVLGAEATLPETGLGLIDLLIMITGLLTISGGVYLTRRQTGLAIK
ncbi:MAG: SdrD B-like domain-containing protein [bacterium]